MIGMGSPWGCVGTWAEESAVNTADRTTTWDAKESGINFILVNSERKCPRILVIFFDKTGFLFYH